MKVFVLDYIHNQSGLYRVTRSILISLSLLILGLPQVALAKSEEFKPRDFGFYFGAGAGAVNVNGVDAFEKDISFKAGEFFTGVHWKWIGVEARTGLSLVDETVKAGENPDTGASIIARTSLDNYFSYYLRLEWERELYRVYGLYGQTSMTTSSHYLDGGDESVTGEGQSYGMGLGIYVSKRMKFNVEARTLLKNELNSFFMTTFNVDFRF